jgi:hypothetical protein
MATQGRSAAGLALAALGAVGVVASLWAPWYGFVIPQAAIQQALQGAHQFGVLGPVISRGATLLEHLGPLHLTAWQAMTTTPALVLVTAVIGGGLALLALTGRADGVARVIAAAGGATVLLVLYRLVSRPGPGGLLHPGWGLFLALFSGAAVAVGGLLASAPQRAYTPGVLDPQAGGAGSEFPWQTTQSVAPPSH